MERVTSGRELDARHDNQIASAATVPGDHDGVVTVEFANLLAGLLELLQRPGVLATDSANDILREALGNSAAILRCAARLSRSGTRRGTPVDGSGEGEQAVRPLLDVVARPAALPPVADAKLAEPSPTNGASAAGVSPSSGAPAVLTTTSFELGAEAFFGARHFVTMNGRQGPPHHHSWRVEATIESSTATGDGVVVGFAEARDLLESLVKPLNKTLLNGVPPFDSIQPTAENMAKHLYGEFKRRFEAGSARLRRVRVWESPTSHATYLETP